MLELVEQIEGGLDGQAGFSAPAGSGEGKQAGSQDCGFDLG